MFLNQRLSIDWLSLIVNVAIKIPIWKRYIIQLDKKFVLANIYQIVIIYNYFAPLFTNLSVGYK